MNSNLISGGGFHLSLGIGQHLWTDLFSEALPFQVGEGTYNVNDQLRPFLNQLSEQMNSQVKLLASKAPPLLLPPVERIGGRLGSGVRQGLGIIRKTASDNVKITGKWNLNITREGSHFSYGAQSITVSAQVRIIADGNIEIGQGWRKIPYRIERKVKGSFTLANVHYDRQQGGLVGNIRDLHLELGEHPLIKTAEKYLDRFVEKKASSYKDVTLLKVAQINQSLEQALGQLKFNAAIDDVAVEINDKALHLTINFLFKQKAPIAVQL